MKVDVLNSNGKHKKELQAGGEREVGPFSRLVSCSRRRKIESDCIAARSPPLADLRQMLRRSRSKWKQWCHRFRNSFCQMLLYEFCILCILLVKYLFKAPAETETQFPLPLFFSCFLQQLKLCTALYFINTLEATGWHAMQHNALFPLEVRTHPQLLLSWS